MSMSIGEALNCFIEESKHAPAELVRLEYVRAANGSEAESTTWARIKDGSMVPPIGKGKPALFPKDEVHAVIRYRIAGASRDEIRRLVAELVRRRGVDPDALARERIKRAQRFSAMGRRSQAHAKVRRARTASGR